MLYESILQWEISMSNPCKECIVKSMCRGCCVLYRDYINNIIRTKCNFYVTPEYDTPGVIWASREATIQLAGIFKRDSTKSITIRCRDKEIISIDLRRASTSKVVKKLYHRDRQGAL